MEGSCKVCGEIEPSDWPYEDYGIWVCGCKRVTTKIDETLKFLSDPESEWVLYGNSKGKGKSRSVNN